MPDSLDLLRPAGPSPRAETHVLPGPAGSLELLLDRADAAPQGIALITHPQPLLGGSPRHKIPHRLAHTVRDAGWLAVRPSFRGVGRSDGDYDHGAGESLDMLDLVQRLRDEAPALPLALIGFSFGAFVLAHVARKLTDAGRPADATILAGLPAGRVPGQRVYDTPTLPLDVSLIHGEADAEAPLENLLQWARPSAHPIIVVPGADHFFTGLQHLLQTLVLAELHAVEATR